MKSRPAGWCVNELHQRSHLPLQRFAALHHTSHKSRVSVRRNQARDSWDEIETRLSNR
jgi:hypothetical protein